MVEFEGRAAMHNSVKLSDSLEVGMGNFYTTRIIDGDSAKEIIFLGQDLYEVYGKNKNYKITEGKQENGKILIIVKKKQAYQTDYPQHPGL